VTATSDEARDVMFQRLLNKDRTRDDDSVESGLYDIRCALVVEVPRVLELPTATAPATGPDRQRTQSNDNITQL